MHLVFDRRYNYDSNFNHAPSDYTGVAQAYVAVVADNTYDTNSRLGVRLDGKEHRLHIK